MQIAIAYADQPDKVAIWADQRRKNKAGTVFFEVINGGWDGYIRGDGRLFISRKENRGRDCILAKIVWRGTAPFYGGRYNEAIAWIEEQVSAGVSERV